MFGIKKFLAVLCCAAVSAGAAGCGSSASSAGGAASAGGSDKVKIVCTVFPAYDWVRELTKGREDKVDISYLLDRGSDMHSFQPTADDILSITNCDLFVYVGGESDGWARDALANVTDRDVKAVALLDAVGSDAKEEEVKEGMQAEEEEHDHEEGEGHDHEEEEPEYDEHVWLSLRNAEKICGVICDDLCAADASGSETYKANFSSYKGELDKLDSEFKSLADGAKTKALIFGDRFPFRYFTDDYGFDYYAAFVGCSAETEASFETITFLSKKLDELRTGVVFTIENSDQKIAKAVIESSTDSKNASIASLDSLQSVNRERVDGGATYLSLMKENYETLKANISA